MDLSFTDEQRELRTLTAKILTDRCTPEHLRDVARSESGTDLDLWRTLAEAGPVAIGWPESAGGGGLGWLETAIVLEEVGRCAAPVPAFAVMALAGPALSAAVAGHDGAVLRGDDTREVESLLHDLAAGGAIATAAVHEEYGDAFAPTATADADGRLSGTKICVPHGTQATHAVVTTVDGLWLVAIGDDAGAGGVTVERQDTTSGVPDARVTFDGAPGIRLGDIVARDALLWRGASAAAMLTAGMCAAALDLTSTYAKGREQFGKPIAAFQAVSQRAADGYIDTEAVRLTAWQGAWKLDNALGSAIDESTPMANAAAAGSSRSDAIPPVLDVDTRNAILTAKFWAAEGGWRVIHAAHHLHGGVGVDRDYPLHRYLLLMKQLELQLGSATPTLAHLGRQLADTRTDR